MLYIAFVIAQLVSNAPSTATTVKPATVWVCSESRELRIGSGTVKTCAWEVGVSQ